MQHFMVQVFAARISGPVGLSKPHSQSGRQTGKDIGNGNLTFHMFRNTVESMSLSQTAMFPNHMAVVVHL
jgi:hypothetical protein